jgi:DNA-binding HxlR family transcriptional regulator
MPRKVTSTNYSNRLELQAKCPMQTTMEHIGGRWKVLILWYVHLGYSRHSLLLKALPSITRKMLNQQLGELVEHGLLTRQETQRPRVVTYSLTQVMLELLPVLGLLNEWGRERQNDNDNAVASHQLKELKSA